MKKHYEPQLIKDNSSGARISHFLGEALCINESDLYALDIHHCPNLKRIEIQSLTPELAPRLSFYDLPKLQQVVLADSLKPAVINTHAETVPEAFVIEGQLESVSASWGELGFSLEAYRAKSKNKEPWHGLELVKNTNFAQFMRQDFLAVTTGDLSEHLTNQQTLKLNANNHWALINTEKLPEILCQGDKHNYFYGLKDTHTLRFLNPEATAYVEEAPQLEAVAGDGKNICLQLGANHQQEINIYGGWGLVRIRAENTKVLRAPKIKALMLLDAPYLKTVDLSLNAEVECRGAVPVPLSQSARYYFHESTVKNILERLFYGEPELLPSLLNILPHASHKQQVRHALNALWQLCEIFVDPATIWQVRCHLMLNNNSVNHKLLKPEELLVPTDWDWKLTEDLHIEAWLTDLKIWDYCQRTVPEAREAAEVMAKTYLNEEKLAAFAKVLAYPKVSIEQKRLVAQAFKHNYYERKKDRPLNNKECIRRIVYEVKNTSDLVVRGALIHAICNMLDKEDFLKEIPPLAYLAPDVFRPVLLELSQVGPNWNECNGSWLSRNRADEAMEKAKQLILMMALAPFKKPQEQLETLETE